MKWYGALAQLGERLHGMQEVSGSIPLGSTTISRQISHDCGTLVDEVSSAGVFRYQVMLTPVSEVSPTGAFGVSALMLKELAMFAQSEVRSDHV
jgi:hypothetical protein